MFIRKAKDIFGTKQLHSNKKPGKRFNKPWFTHECKSARQNYRRAKRLYKRYGGDVFKQNFYEKEKLYKKKLKSSDMYHKSNVKQRLSFLRSRNTKEYWKILNTNIVQTKKPSVNTTDLYDFLKKHL